MTGITPLWCIFGIIGVLVWIRVCQWFFSIAQNSAFENGIKAPLKKGAIIFILIFAAIKILGYELDMEVAIMYFSLMLAGLAGIISGFRLGRIYLAQPELNERST